MSYYDHGAAFDGRSQASYQNGSFGVQVPGFYADSQAYGALQTSSQKGFTFVRGQKKRMNLVAILGAIFGPWLMFASVNAAMTFSLHYKQPTYAYGIVILGFLVVAGSFIWAAFYQQRRHLKDPRFEPSWHTFFFATLLVSWLAGLLCGDVTYSQYMQPYYDTLNLNIYPNIDPSLMRGQQVMDGGRVIFSENAKLDLSKSASFRNADRFCVAPVTIAGPNGTDALLDTYDFWAVGSNCCSGDKADFHCGDYGNPHAHGGLRLMRDDQRAFYRLAVQQAEAAYNIKAAHPLFFTWMQDPILEVNSYRDNGIKYFELGTLTYLLVQSAIVTISALFFSRMGHI